MQVIFRVLFIGFLTFGFIGAIDAQDNGEVRKVKTDDGEFIIHTVEAGQTLYAISKIYSVTVEDIVTVNSELENFGIRIGQTLRVPVKKVNKKEAKKSVVKISGDTIYHEVVKKETLYGLSKKYQISTDEIEESNPELKDGLKIGMVIKIPTVPVSDSSKTEIDFQRAEVDSLTLHEVLPKETLFSLSKEYGVSLDSIQMVNDGLKEGLQVGSSIRIPIENELFITMDTLDWEEHDSSYVHRLLFGDTLKIGVFLPFCTRKNLELQEENENEEIYQLTKISLEFMRGISLAMDSLTSKGYHVDVQYFDNENDTSTIKRILTETDFKSYHLFIGPLFQVNFKLVSEKAKELHIPIVSPVKISSSLLLDNPYVVKSKSSSPSQTIFMANYLGKNYKDSNLIIFSGGTPKDKRYASIFQKYLNNAVNDSVPIHRIWTPSSTNYSKYIKKGESSYIAIISSDEAFVSSSLSIFYKMIDEDTKITVFGIDSWQKFGSISFDYLMAMNVSYPQQQYLDYENKEVTSFVKNYRELYYTDPSKEVFSGFDIGYYFGNGFFESEGNWESYLMLNPEKGFSISFDFVKIGNESGFENQGGYVLRYEDYDLVLVH
jgi:LysM repeat protein